MLRRTLILSIAVGAVIAMNFCNYGCLNYRRSLGEAPLLLVRETLRDYQGHPTDDRFLPKMSPRKSFSPRKIIFAKSSETRFPKVSRQSEPSSGGKRLFKIFDFSKKCPPDFHIQSFHIDEVALIIDGLQFCRDGIPVVENVARSRCFGKIENFERPFTPRG